MSIFIIGPSWSEVIGVSSLLQDSGIFVARYHIGTGIKENDVLILCLGSVPLLGWGRYLRLIRFLALRYRCHVVVLHPREIPLKIVTIPCQVYGLCGNFSIDTFRTLLLSIVYFCQSSKYLAHNNNQDDGITYSLLKNIIKLRGEVSFLKEWICILKRVRTTGDRRLSNAWRSQLLCVQMKRLCGRRLAMIYRLGFKKTHHFHVFSSGM